MKRGKTKETKIIQFLDYKGFSPIQIKHICINILKLSAHKVNMKVNRYVKEQWIEKAKVRFTKENIMKELIEGGYIE